MRNIFTMWKPIFPFARCFSSKILKLCPFYVQGSETMEGIALDMQMLKEEKNVFKVIHQLKMMHFLYM